MGFKLLFVGLILWVMVSFKIQNSNGAEEYQMTALNAHNRYRAMHGSAALIMDEALNDAAVKCAEYYANQMSMDSTCKAKNGAGENLVGGWWEWTPDQLASLGTKLWYDEDEVSKKNYDYNSLNFRTATGHFTQVVWANSKNFGFGVVTLQPNNYLVTLGSKYTVGVALYNPPGNYDGEFRDNVFKRQ